MKVEIGISEPDRNKSAAALKRLLGETYALYIKTHGYHWNVTGPRFQSLHEVFMTQYTELWRRWMNWPNAFARWAISPRAPRLR